MSQSLQSLLVEQDDLTRQIESARFMLENINATIREDQQALETHWAAKVEIAAGKAVMEARLVDLEFELERQQTPEEIDDEQSFTPTMS